MRKIYGVTYGRGPEYETAMDADLLAIKNAIKITPDPVKEAATKKDNEEKIRKSMQEISWFWVNAIGCMMAATVLLSIVIHA